MRSFDELVSHLEDHVKNIANPASAQRVKEWLERFRDISMYPEWQHSRGTAGLSSWRLTAWFERLRQLKANPECESAEDLGEQHEQEPSKRAGMH